MVNMPEISFHGELTKEKFFLEWYGLLGRDIGTNKNPHRKYIDNPMEFLEHIKMCESEHDDGDFCRPCWISSQPTRPTKGIVGEPMAIEKLFYDFDDDSKYCSNCDEYIKKDDLMKDEEKKSKKGLCPKCKNECVEKPRMDMIKKEVSSFINDVTKFCQSEKPSFNPIPFVVKTYKGFHVYYFLYEIFKFESKNYERAKKLYNKIKCIFITREYQFMDDKIVRDINRLARVPLTPHEKTGKICEVLDENIQPTKIRSLNYYKSYGIPTYFVNKIIDIVKEEEEEQSEIEQIELEQLKTNGNNGNGKFPYGIRPCFRTKMEKGEMCHAQRLAWLLEIYHSGYDTKEKMLELCRQTWNDFIEKKSMQQIEDFFKHERWVYRPYKCSTLQEKGWCIGIDECRRLKEKYGNGNKQY